MIKLKNIFDLPSRAKKPRAKGLTMVIDTGLPIPLVENFSEIGGEFIDYVKLGWGTSLVTADLDKKVAAYERFGIPVCFGGTLFEFAYLQGKVSEYLAFARDFGIALMEVSDGAISISHNEKLRWIETIAADFRVLSECGSKDGDTIAPPSEWVRLMSRELNAGAWKCIAEGRETATSGLYRKSGELRMGLVEEIVDSIQADKLIWEAPLKEHQVWFVKKFGTDVNLGNISPFDLISLETIRLGLRSDTMMHFHAKF